MTTLAQLLGLGGGTPDAWTSGMTVKQWEVVVSPLDGELYRRKTATGAGTIDPLNDTTNYRAASYDRAMNVVNAWTANDAPWTAAAALTDVPALSTGVASEAVNGGAAGSRILLVSATGRGVLEFAGIVKAAGSQALTQKTRLELIVDDRVLYDYTTIPNASAGIKWMLLAGRTTGATGSTVASSEIRFSTGFQIYFTPVGGVQSNCTFYSAYRGLES